MRNASGRARARNHGCETPCSYSQWRLRPPNQPPPCLLQCNNCVQSWRSLESLGLGKHTIFFAGLNRAKMACKEFNTAHYNDIYNVSLARHNYSSCWIVVAVPSIAAPPPPPSSPSNRVLPHNARTHPAHMARRPQVCAAAFPIPPARCCDPSVAKTRG
jgi:hypothetical protein